MDGIVIERASLILVIRGLYAAAIATVVLVQAYWASTKTMAGIAVTTQPAPLWFGSSSNLHEQKFV